MLLETHLAQKTLAHAYFLTGNAESYVKKMFPANSYEIILYAEKTGIHEVRKMIQKTSLVSLVAMPQIIVINADQLAWQAKTALLKIIEEPPPRTHFILYGTSKRGLSPALASRLLNGGHVEDTRHPHKEKAEAFLMAGSDPKKREKILNDISDTESLILFLNSVEHILSDKDMPQRIGMMERIHTARSFLGHPVALPSIIKDYISFFL